MMLLFLFGVETFFLLHLSLHESVGSLMISIAAFQAVV